MATTTGEVAGKETVVRVKRKRDDDPFESLWLEMAPRAIKRHEPDLTKLSLGEPAPKTSGGGPTKLLFRRVETMTTSEVKNLFLPDFLKKVKEKKGERARQKLEPSKNTKDKKGQLLAAAKESHEASARTARFQQVWRSRTKAGKAVEEEDPMQEFCRLYDVVRFDMEEELAAKTKRSQVFVKREAQLREGQLLCNYLPLLREVLPSAAAEIEASPAMISEMESRQDLSSNTKDYVYDVYVLDEKADGKSNDGSHPVIQITEKDDQDFQIDMESDFDSEDSNDENNPNNDYPEEEDQFDAKRESDSDSSDEGKINHFGNDDEEYDTVLSDEERDIQRWR